MMQHNDLISRAVAKEAVRNIIGGGATELARVFKEIDKVPAVDAAPVRHGRWEEKMEHMGFMCCSVCHDCFVEKEWIFNKKWAWCPQCGARMDGGETNG